MAEKKTTSNSGIFGQSLGGDLDLSQFSGPKLFTPAPLPPAPTIPQTLPQQSHVSNSPLPAPNTPIPPPSQYHTPLQTPNISSNFNPAAPQPQRLPPLPTTTPPKQYDATQVLRQTPRPNMTPVPLTQGLDNVPLQSPPMNVTPFGGTNHPPAPMIPTFTPSNQTNQFLTGPMIPPSNTPAQVFNPTMSPQQAQTGAFNQPSTYNPKVFTPNQPPKAPTMFVPPSNPEPSANNYYTPSQNMNQAPAMSGYQQQQALPTEYNISPFASMNTQQNLMHSVPKVTPHWFYLRTWTIHLPFYKKMTEWQVFSKADSHKLEHEYLLHRGTKNGGSVVVQTDGGRYDVDLNDMTRNSVYWKEEPSTVRRCTWFYKEENQFLPYETEPAEKLEEEYLSMMSKGIFNIRVDISQNDFVLFHNPDTMVQYSNNQDLQWTGEDAKTRPKIVRRGIADEVYQQIPQGEEGSIEHVVFVIHGIGPVADLRGRTIVECVDDLRRHSLHFTNNNGFTIQGRPANRVEFFPIQWYSSIRDEKFGIDKQLEQLSLPSISKLRHFTNETLTDILFFTSPLYCQTIVDTVITEMNRIYKLFKSRNPTYNGTTSVCGHSLGSVIAFDILANQGKQKNQQQVNGHQQPSSYENSGEVVEDTILRGSSGPPSRNSSAPPSLDTSMSDLSLDDVTNMHDLLAKLNLLSLEQQFEDEQIDLDTLLMCQDGDLKDLGVPFGPRKKLVAYMKNKDNPQPTSAQKNPSAPTNNTTLLTRGTNTANSSDQSDMSLKSAGSGTGQPVVTYKALDFQTDSLFALGSPIGLFLTTRGVTTLGLEYRLPFCNSFMNIFHPYDPVVYRLEPLVNEMIDIPPVLIPHHKGRKRFHLEIKDNITRVSAKVKSGIMDAVNRTWTSINDFARSHQPDYQPAHDDSLSVVGENEALDTTNTEEEMALKARENALDFGQLNSGKRVDFALQEKPFEILNEYLFALGSHTCYWTSEDVALLMLKQIYKINE